MDWQLLGMVISPIFILIGYLHIRLNSIERESRMTVSESDVKEILNYRLENVLAWQTLCEKRLDRIEESLDRLTAKIDQLILKA